MTFSFKATLLSLAFCTCVYSSSQNAGATKSGSDERGATKDAGEYVSPSGACKAILKINSLGGFKTLIVTRDRDEPRVEKDVTGIAWTSASTLVYTVSPIYGKPGVYAYDCESNRITKIVAARNVDKAYPNGADYFELRNVLSTDESVVVFSYYAPDVDKVDFRTLRSQNYVYKVNLDGTSFMKAE